MSRLAPLMAEKLAEYAIEAIGKHDSDQAYSMARLAACWGLDMLDRETYCAGQEDHLMQGACRVTRSI